MNGVTGALVIACAFVAGAVPFGVLVSRTFYGRDIRTAGSGNIGAANALRTLGRRGAAVVLLLDLLKGLAPTLAGHALGGDPLAAFAGLAAVCGHCFSPFLGFRGGKGVATGYGVAWALAWPAGVAFTIVWLAAAIAFGYASLASLLACAVVPLVLWFVIGTPGLVYGLCAFAVILVMHRANVVRLARGEEPTLSLFGGGSPTR